MTNESGPGAPAGATGAGIGYAGRRSDTSAAAPVQSSQRVRLQSFKPLVKGALRGFATIEMAGGLVLHECPICRGGDGKAWVALPAKPVLNRDGRHRHDINGKSQYAPVAEWRSRDLANGFSAAVIELVRLAHPSALDGRDAP